MAYYDKAVRQILPENATQRRITPTQFIIHTAVDAPGRTDLWVYFGRTDVGVESHFYLTTAGTVVQMMDTTVRADANYQANDRAISVEIEDDGNPDAPMNDAQLAALIDLARWARDTHNIPAVQAPAWDQPGFGYHTLFPQWSNVKGKTCPGSGKKTQFRAALLPALQEETDMPDMPHLTNAQFVTHSYRTILSREPDADGQAFWTGKLDRKEMTRNDVRFEFLLVLIGAIRTKLDSAAAGATAPVQAAAFEQFLTDLEALAKAARS